MRKRKEKNLELRPDKLSRWRRFRDNWTRRNVISNVVLYGVQVAAVLFAFAMVVEMIDMIKDFNEPYESCIYEDMTVGGLIFRMLSKGWLPGLAICVLLFFCNRRLLQWKADGFLWMFNLLFVISVFTLAVEDEMFLYFSVSAIGGLAMYVLSLFLPRRVDNVNTTIFQQCRKPSNWLVTVSFVVLMLWCSGLSYVIGHMG